MDIKEIATLNRFKYAKGGIFVVPFTTVGQFRGGQLIYQEKPFEKTSIDDSSQWSIRATDSPKNSC